MFYLFFFFQIVSQTTVAVDSNSNILSASDLSLETAKLLEHRMKLVRNASRGDEEVDYLLSHGLVGKTVQLSLNDKQAAAEKDRQQSSAHQARTQTERTAIWQG